MNLRVVANGVRIKETSTCTCTCTCTCTYINIQPFCNMAPLSIDSIPSPILIEFSNNSAGNVTQPPMFVTEVKVDRRKGNEGYEIKLPGRKSETAKRRLVTQGTYTTSGSQAHRVRPTYKHSFTKKNYSVNFLRLFVQFFVLFCVNFVHFLCTSLYTFLQFLCTLCYF